MNVAQLLRSIRSRTDHNGIITADHWLRDLTECVGGRCPSEILEGVTKRQWRSWLKAAENKLTFQAGKFGEFRRKAQDGNPLPPHTIAVFPCVITTTTQDRDGDVLESKGAQPDPLMPLLWQHVPDMPIGRLLGKAKVQSAKVTGRFTIASTDLGQDAALLAEHGALRISHGFLPTKWEPLDDGSGFHILEFKILETSLVSVPSNPDAVIEAFSREKLAHPLVKAWAGAKFKERPTIQAVGIDLAKLPAGTTITLGELAKPSDKQACTCSTHKQAHEPAMPIKGAVPFKKTLAAPQDEAWDADAAVKGLRSWAGVDEDEPTDAAWTKYEQGFGYVDGDGDKLTAYSYPHHEVKDGKLVVNFKALAAGIAALNGGRGGSKISNSDREAVYQHLKKHYAAFPDAEAPPLKSVEVEAKGVYVEFENSWDDIRCDLADSLLAFLMAADACSVADWAYIVDMFPDRAIICVCRGGNSFYGPCDYTMPFDHDRNSYYSLAWAMGADEEPAWTGEPQKIQITPSIQPAAERALRAMAEKAFLKDKHVAKLAKAMDQLDSAAGHDDATGPVKKLAKQAHAAIKSVHDAHEKGVVTAAHKNKLVKAMGYCATGAEHEDATPPIVKMFKSAGKLVKDVSDDTGMGEAAHKPEGVKAGAKLSAANKKSLKAAFHHLKAAETHVEATKATSAIAGQAASKVGGLFATGGDNGSDYDADGNYTGDDMNAYTAAGESAEQGGKSGAAVSKESTATINEAKSLTKQLAKHPETTKAVKALANGAYAHLKAVVPADAETAQDDDDGDMSLHGGDPTGMGEGKTLGERLSDAAADAREAVASGDSSKWFDLVEAQKDIAALSECVDDAKIEIAVMHVAQA